MAERIFNLFLIVDPDNTIREFGAVSYQRTGNDKEKMKFLQSRVQQDYADAKRFKVPPHCMRVGPDGSKEVSSLSWECLHALMRTGAHMTIFESAFEAMKAPAQPLMVITCIVDGKPRIEGEFSFPMKPTL